MKLKCAVIVFPGSTGAEDIKTACDFFEWKTDLIWHNESIKNKYDVIFFSPGNPYGSDNYSKEDLIKTSTVMRNIPYSKTLIVGFSEGFQILCRAGLLKGYLEKNINDKKVNEFREFLFLDNEILLPISTNQGNFIKNNDFNHDIILKYKNNDISDNLIAGIYNYENKVIGMIANPHLAILPKLRQIDGRKVFDLIKNVI